MNLNDKSDFWKHVNKNGIHKPHMNTCCWEWMTKSFNKKGYAKFQINGKRWFVHRLSLLWEQGFLTDGMFVLHECDNPKCVNPSHLREGTHRDNMDDRKLRPKNHKFSKYFPRNHIRKLLPDTVKQVRILNESGLSQRKIAHQLCINRSQVRDILGGKTYKDVL